MFPGLADWIKMLLAFAVSLLVAYVMTPPVKRFAEKVGLAQLHAMLHGPGGDVFDQLAAFVLGQFAGAARHQVASDEREDGREDQSAPAEAGPRD